MNKTLSSLLFSIPKQYFSTSSFSSNVAQISLLTKNYLIPTIRITETSKDTQMLSQSLQKRVSLAPLFYHCAPVVLDFEDVEQNVIRGDIDNIIQTVKRSNLIPVGINFTYDSVIQTAASQQNMPLINSLRNSKPNAYEELMNEKERNKPEAQTNTKSQSQKQKPKVSSDESSYVEPLVITASVRTGDQVYAKGTDLVIMGNVNSAAEVLADGNIYVFGVLRGRALAGLSGNTSAKVFATKFNAELISIANAYVSDPPSADTTLVQLDSEAKLSFSSIDQI